VTAATARHALAHARHRNVMRTPVILVVLCSLVAAGVLSSAVPNHGLGPVPSTPTSTLGLATVAPPVGSESSSWYCTGDTGTPGSIAEATLYFVNTGRYQVDGSITVVSNTGNRATRTVSIPGGHETTFAPALIEQGSWLASTIELDGGGVTVSEMVKGAAGWSEAPCATRTSGAWYFATGSTQPGDLLFSFLYNPSTAPAVVDLEFVTTQGESAPAPFEGLVIAPGSVVVAGVGSFVQNEQSVSTIVQARSGQVVAEQLEESAVGPVSGLSLLLGSPQPETRWNFPRSVNVGGGQVTLDVFNPTGTTERVAVDVELASGPLAPFTQQVASDTTWRLIMSSTTRIPANVDYSATVVSAGGPGVVVGRIVQSSSSGAAPQWGMANAVAGPAAAIPSGKWVIPSPAVPGNPPETGAEPFALALHNTGNRDITVSVGRLTPSGPSRLAAVPVLRIAPRSFLVVEPAELAPSSGAPLLIDASGPLASIEEATPAGMPGVVALAGIPLDG